MKISITLEHENWERLLLTLAELPYKFIEPLTPTLKEIQRQGAEQFKEPPPTA